MKHIRIHLSLIALVALAACSGDKVSFETLETNRAVANENSAYNAKKWRAENGFAEAGILARGDSTQQAKCPQGDGWASVDLTNPATKQPVLALKCSTVSPNIGCLKASDFKDRAVLANQENACNAEIPTTLKKIEGMTAVGLFAGRGDVILAMGLAVLVGCWLGWRLRGVAERLSARRRKGPQQ